jgi:serine/threonine protein kinase
MLKLADFGLARPFETEQQRMYTNRVITLWYRPPELLLGATAYGTAIDLWSAGCIFAELLLRKPILAGRNEYEQLDLIFKLLGTPDEQSWPGCTQLQYYDMIIGQKQHRYQSRFQEKFGQCVPLLHAHVHVITHVRIHARTLASTPARSHPRPRVRIHTHTHTRTHSSCPMLQPPPQTR